MTIQTFYFNPYRECTYVLRNEQKCLIIDPGMYSSREQERLKEYLDTEQLQPEAILITHTHPDHICGLEFLEQLYPDIPVIGGAYPQPAEQKDDQVSLPDFSFQIIPTPGHKEDSVCYYFSEEQILFTGDTLFQESIGRTDLPGGNMTALVRSLERLCELPDDTRVYPGHGYATTIGYEEDNNPYL